MRSGIWVVLLSAGTGMAVEFGIAVIDGKAAIVSPLPPIDPAGATRALETEEARTSPQFIDQLAERQVLWLRGLVAKGGSEANILSALDNIAAWWRKATPIRAEAADINALERRLRTDPSNLTLGTAVARYWVRELELERAGIEADKPLMFRINPRTGNWLCTSCYLQRGSNEAPSRTYPKAKRAVDGLLSRAPNDPGGLWQAALLERMTGEGYRTTSAAEIDLEKRAAAGKGPWAAAARIASVSQDGTVNSLRARANMLMGKKVIGSKLSTVTYDIHTGKRAPEKDIYVPVSREPYPGEIAEGRVLARQADELENRERVEVLGTLRAYPAEVDVFRMLAYWPLGRNAPLEPQWRERERILRYAIMLDPTDWRLHFSRASNWHDLENRKMELPSAEAQAILRMNRDGDFNYIYEQTREKIAADPFVPYVFTLQAVRRAPAYPFAHQRLAMTMQRLIRYEIDGVPVLQDAFQNAVAEMKLTQYAALRMQAHREEWRDQQTGEALGKVIEFTKRQLAAVPVTPPDMKRSRSN